MFLRYDYTLPAIVAPDAEISPAILRTSQQLTGYTTGQAHTDLATVAWKQWNNP